jgi:primosomal protein N'
MAMIQCRECNAEISDKAISCPRCGAEMIKGKIRGALSTIVVVGVILVAIFFAMDAMFSTNKRARADFEKSLDNMHRANKNLERAYGK